MWEDPTGLGRGRDDGIMFHRLDSRCLCLRRPDRHCCCWGWLGACCCKVRSASSSSSARNRRKPKLKSGNPVFYPTALVHFDAPIHTPTPTHTHTHSHPTKPNSSSPRPRAIDLHRWGVRIKPGSFQRVPELRPSSLHDAALLHRCLPTTNVKDCFSESLARPNGKLTKEALTTGTCAEKVARKGTARPSCGFVGCC
jgi:hypothetical protein